MSKETKYASLADVLINRLGEGYVLKDSDHGVGLFSKKVFCKNEIICAYDGQRIHRSDIGNRNTSHMLSIKDSDDIIDGLPFRRDLKKDYASGLYWPEDLNLYFVGWAFMANSSRNSCKNSNAYIDYIIDDSSIRIQNYNPFEPTKISNNLKNVLPKKPYLFAKETILIDEEILWDYNPFVKDSIVIDLTT